MIDDRLKAFIEGGGSGGESDGGQSFEPTLLDVGRMFDVVCRAAEASGGAGQLGGVVGILATDGEDEVGLLAEVVQGRLAVLRGLTNGVGIDHFGIRALPSDFPKQRPDMVDRLGGLGNEADFFDVGEFWDVAEVEDHPGVGKIAP